MRLVKELFGQPAFVLAMAAAQEHRVEVHLVRQPGQAVASRRVSCGSGAEQDQHRRGVLGVMAHICDTRLFRGEARV
jgi:hypothetical protein